MFGATFETVLQIAWPAEGQGSLVRGLTVCSVRRAVHEEEGCPAERHETPKRLSTRHIWRRPGKHDSPFRRSRCYRSKIRDPGPLEARLHGRGQQHTAASVLWSRGFQLRDSVTKLPWPGVTF
jgi:hypothetical protein